MPTEVAKRDGEEVREGEPICMIAGDKATTELEAPANGILRISAGSPPPGEEVPVGTLLAYLVAPGEQFSPPSDFVGRHRDVSLTAGAVTSPGRGTPAEQSFSVAGAPTVPGSGTPAEQSSSVAGAVTVLGRGMPAEQSFAAEGHEAAGAGGARGAARIVASPRARRAAVGLGVDWRTLVGSGRGGRILERDVAQAAAAPTQQASRIRQLTAERVSLSAKTVVPVTLTTEANATTLVRLREQSVAERGPIQRGPAEQTATEDRRAQDSAEGAPGYTDLLVKLVALALTEHPPLNGEHAEVNIGIAVDTAAGLLAPVIGNADTRSVASIASESRRLVDAARTQTIQANDLQGATFTITNLGMYDVDAFTPIINVPQCAILGIGRIVARPVVIDEATEQVAVQRMLTLSLTFDHRLVDGAPAARFLQRIKHLVERPTLWLFR
jgi:pyruvate dehydrogenase E2 component (dihydrolipoamide acetyltransferase)